MADRIQVLFLDIDGVLNSEASFRYWHGLGLVSSKVWCPIATSNFKCLLEMAPSTVRIVLSSSWRLGLATLDEMKHIFDARGVDSSRVIDRTPHLPGHPRGHEINSWLHDNVERLNISSWAILDDDSDMDPLMDTLVKTSFRTGLTLAHVDEVLKKLRKGLIPKGYQSGDTVITTSMVQDWATKGIL